MARRPSTKAPPAPMSLRRRTITTARQYGAASPTPYASSRTRPRLAGPTDHLESHSAAGSTWPATLPLALRFILDSIDSAVRRPTRMGVRGANRDLRVAAHHW